MEDRPLPIYFESTHWKLAGKDFGKIVGIRDRTRCARLYSVEWVNGEKLVYKGAATRPAWIAHIFKDKAAWLVAQAKKKQAAFGSA
jgi:hypothetical protein